MPKGVLEAYSEVEIDPEKVRQVLHGYRLENTIKCRSMLSYATYG